VPSTDSHHGQSRRPLAAVVALLVLAYAVLIAAEILLGLVAAGLLGLVVYARAAIVRDMDYNRILAVGAIALVAAGYLTVIGGRPLLGVTLGALVVLVGWLTAPRGPVARAARWVRDAREDVRVVRETVTDDGDGPTAHGGDAASGTLDADD
jgi:MFS family permease